MMVVPVVRARVSIVAPSPWDQGPDDSSVVSTRSRDEAGRGILAAATFPGRDGGLGFL